MDPHWGQKRLVWLSIDIITFSTAVGLAVESEFWAAAFRAGAKDTFFEYFDAFEFSFGELGEVDPAVVFPPFPDVVVECYGYFFHVFFIQLVMSFTTVSWTFPGVLYSANVGSPVPVMKRWLRFS